MQLRVRSRPRVGRFTRTAWLVGVLAGVSSSGCDKRATGSAASTPDGTHEDTTLDPAQADVSADGSESAPASGSAGELAGNDADGGSEAGEVGEVGSDGEPCGDTSCQSPQRCVEYYGIAGKSGPRFRSCEVPCKGADDASCPAGTSCVTIADGPGSVCR